MPFTIQRMNGNDAMIESQMNAAIYAVDNQTKKGNMIKDRCELNVDFIGKNDNRQNNTPSNEI